jgi:hypothetical protein
MVIKHFFFGVTVFCSSTLASAQALFPSIVQSNFDSGASTVESINGFTINGVPTIFYQGFLPAQKPNVAIYESQYLNNSWTTSIIATNYLLGFSSATVVNGTPYVAYEVAGGIPDMSCTATIVSQSNGGAWNTVYQSPTPNDHLGVNIAMGIYNNQPVAVFDGPYPWSGAYSPNAVLVERTAGSNWQTTNVPVPYNAGFFHFSPVQVGDNLDFLGTTDGGFGDLLMSRAGGYGGTWSSQFFNQFTNDAAGNLANEGGTLAFISSTGSAYYNTLSGSTLSTTAISPSGTNASIVGSDLQVIAGIPTLAYLDRTDGNLHLDQLVNGVMTDRVLASGVADWAQAVSVFPGPDGNVAVAAILEQGSSSEVEYFGALTSVPEPVSITAVLSLAATGLLGRPRKARANDLAQRQSHH